MKINDIISEYTQGSGFLGGMAQRAGMDASVFGKFKQSLKTADELTAQQASTQQAAQQQAITTKIPVIGQFKNFPVLHDIRGASWIKTAQGWIRLGRTGPEGSVVDVEQEKWINQQYIQAQSLDVVSVKPGMRIKVIHPTTGGEYYKTSTGWSSSIGQPITNANSVALLDRMANSAGKLEKTPVPLAQKFKTRSATRGR